MHRSALTYSYLKSAEMPERLMYVNPFLSVYTKALSYIAHGQFDYTRGQLSELIDVIIEEKVALFVCAIGIPPKEVVERLHKAGILVMNMVGHPKHVKKALDVGVDLICAQAGEGGGHTGDTPASILIPACVDAVKGHKSPLTGKPVYVIGAGAVFDGRGLAANLMWGAQAVCTC